MPREATGQVIKHASGYSARVRIGPGPNDRPSFTLAARSDEAADERAALLADLAKRMRPMAAPDEIKEILEAAGNARTEKGLEGAKEAAEAIISGDTSKASSALAPTFTAFAEDWTSGRLRDKHPDHVRAKDSTRDEELLRLYINPGLGPTRIAAVTLDACERVMGRLPSALSPATRRHVAQCMRKILSLAVYPGRHLAANPIPREWMPKVPRGNAKAKTCLYPEEDAKLLQCKDVQLERRLAYGILTREGMRASELGSLKWRDVDLERGRIRLDENKTDDPRAWALSPDVVRTLAWWKKRTGGEADDVVLGLDLHEASRWLRGRDDDPERYPGDLRRADVTRPELFERSATRMPMRLHDLRATFVTVSLANGETEQWVTDRTGHKSSQMLALYTRQARTWSELALGLLSPLDALLPEFEAPPKTKAKKAAQPAADGVPPVWASNGHRRVGHDRLELSANGLRVRCSTN